MTYERRSNRQVPLMTKPWMIYGANGYSGALIAREAARRGHMPVLAGRSAAAIHALGQELGLETRVFDLPEPTAARAGIDGMALVLHCAGPFSATSAPMIAACLDARAHYLDITGEISVFEFARSCDAKARAAGIVLCPGVGFDVIPTDCVAASLKAALPDATHLALGFDSRSAVSPGTAKTSVEGLAQGGQVRRDGRIERVPFAYKTRTIDFGDGPKPSMTLPWGDVSTAFWTTGIPNIEVYMAGSPRMISSARRANSLRWLLGLRPVQSFLKRRIDRTVTGPSDEARNKSRTYVWGEATNGRGETRTARVVTANGYSVTVSGSLAVVEHVLANEPSGGYTTPARLIGPDLVSSLPGSGPIVVS
jgi:short subunit dehydrogenase-like uncharacterized protein